MANDIHTRRLAEFLAMDAMGQSELKRTVEKSVPRELSYHDFDGKVVNARELLISEGIQGSTLIPTEIYATVLEGSEPMKCMRDVLPTYQLASPSVSVPYGETGTYAPIVAEGAEIPVEDQTYSSVTFTAKKYAVRPLITNEMVDDAQFDIIASEVRKSGMRLENALNRAALYEIVDAHGNTADCGNAGATPLLFCATAATEIISDGFQPTDLIMTPVFYGACLKEGLVLAGSFAGDMYKTGKLGNFMGLNCHIGGFTAALSPSSHIWEFDTDNDTGALMVDRNACGAIGMRQDIKVEQYADSIRQMQGISVSMRFDVQAFIGNSIANIIY